MMQRPLVALGLAEVEAIQAVLWAKQQAFEMP